MIVITVVYASERLFARSSTTSRTVARRRFQSRSMTAVSSGPRNVFGPPRRARFSRRMSPATAGSSHLSPQIAAALQETRVPLADELAAVCERDVERHDEMTVTGRVSRPAGAVAAFEQSRERHRGELALRDRLAPAGPPRG